jgi:acyl carrier protein
VQSTFDIVVSILAATCDIPRDAIKPDSHLLRDLGVDSLTLLDISHSIDDALTIRLPIDQWLHTAHMDTMPDRALTVRDLCSRIDDMIMRARA